MASRAEIQRLTRIEEADAVERTIRVLKRRGWSGPVMPSLRRLAEELRQEAGDLGAQSTT